MGGPEVSTTKLCGHVLDRNLEPGALRGLKNLKLTPTAVNIADCSRYDPAESDNAVLSSEFAAERGILHSIAQRPS